MIGRIEGILLEKKPPNLLVDVSGLGYEIDVSMQTYYRLPEVSQKVILYTHLMVREDAHILYGFYDNQEREIFRLLLKVNGVGAKLALALLSALEPAQFIRIISEGDITALVKVPGVGKKTAERLIIEMKDRLAKVSGNFNIDLRTDSNLNQESCPINDAISALMSLGYKQQEATRAIQAFKNDYNSSEELIKEALKRM